MSTPLLGWKKRESLEKKYSEFVISVSAGKQATKKKYHLRHDKLYQCPQCEWKTKHVGHFDRHMELRHSSSGSFSCKYCPFSCVDGKLFKRHTAQHEKPFHCEMCPSAFSAKKDLQRHIWKHTGRFYSWKHTGRFYSWKHTGRFYSWKHTGRSYS